MDVDKAIQEANERERKEWALVRWGFKAFWVAWIIYMVWLIIKGSWRDFAHAWQNLFC